MAYLSAARGDLCRALDGDGHCRHCVSCNPLNVGREYDWHLAPVVEYVPDRHHPGLLARVGQVGAGGRT